MKNFIKSNMEQDIQTFCTCLYIFPAERKFTKTTCSRSNNVCNVVEKKTLLYGLQN